MKMPKGAGFRLIQVGIFYRHYDLDFLWATALLKRCTVLRWAFISTNYFFLMIPFDLRLVNTVTFFRRNNDIKSYSLLPLWSTWWVVKFQNEIITALQSALSCQVCNQGLLIVYEVPILLYRFSSSHRSCSVQIDIYDFSTYALCAMKIYTYLHVALYIWKHVNEVVKVTCHMWNGPVWHKILHEKLFRETKRIAWTCGDSLLILLRSKEEEHLWPQNLITIITFRN